MANSITPSNTIDMRLPIVPDIKTGEPAELFRELSIIYTALRQLQNGTDKYLDIPPSYKNAAYTITYLDRGQSIDTDSNVTIPSEANAGTVFTLGMCVAIVNLSSTPITIIGDTGVTLVLAGTATTGNRTLAGHGIATVRRVGTDAWYVLGAGVS